MTEPGSLRRSVNPLLPSNEFIPDGEPRVFGDRVYLYGSHDLADRGWCAGDYVCYSAKIDDLANWQFEGVIYRGVQDPHIAARRAQGKDRMVDRLFAPDVVQIDGRFYLYYGVGLSASGFGVAVADAPVGPFEYVGRVRYPDGDLAFGAGKAPYRRLGFDLGEYPYDPALLLHEGRLFLYFGLLNCSVVELDPRDKRTVLRNGDSGEYVTEIFRSSPLGAIRALRSGADRQTMMMNGPSIREVDGRFVLSYWAIGGQGFCGMHYAASDSPLGTFTPQGPLVALGDAWKNGQNGATDQVGNTHGGMFRAGDTWYQIYHRHAVDGRQTCGVPLTRRADGSFEQAGYTSLGLDPRPLDAHTRWPAHIACHLTGRRRLGRKRRPVLVLREHSAGETDHDSGRSTLQILSKLRAGDVAGFKYLDFGADPDRTLAFTITVDPCVTGHIEVRLDDPDGPAIATVPVPTGSVGHGWVDLTGPVLPTVGTHAVFLVFHPDQGELGDVAFFGFASVTPP